MVLNFEEPKYGIATLLKYNISVLDVDEAVVNITSKSVTKVWMYYLLSDCYKCPYTKFLELEANEEQIKVVDTAYDITWRFYDTNQGHLAFNDTQFCTVDPHFGEFGIYDLIIHANKSCSFSTVEEAVNINTSLFLIVFVILLFIIFMLPKKMVNWYKSRNREKTSNQNDENDPNLNSHKLTASKPISNRFKSLDTFRGIIIVLMIFGNSGAGRYIWIQHATWNGMPVADLIFPCFLWIMGVCIPISVKSHLRKDIPKKQILRAVLWRSIKLFIIGLCLGTVNGVKLENIRIFGVLQRFGIDYFFGTSIYVLFAQSINLPPQNRFKKMFMDIIVLSRPWLLMFSLILLHLILIFYLPVPGCPSGYLGPGGKHDNAQFKECIGGATGYVDRIILGINHIYQWSSSKEVYDAKPFEPEGLFGCILTLVQTFFGVQCGVILLMFNDWHQKIFRWLLWGTVCGILGGFLCSFSKEGGLIPINKNMWSLSFVLVTVCIAFYLLTICYYLIDVKKWWSGTPFFYSGMNAILIYIGHVVTFQMLPWNWNIGDMNTHFIILAQDLWNALLWMGIAYVLYKKKLFYTV